MKSTTSAPALVSLGLAVLARAQSVTTVIPEPQGTELSDAPIVVPAGGDFDGGMVFYDRSRKRSAL